MRTSSQSKFANLLVVVLLFLIIGTSIFFPINALAQEKSRQLGNNLNIGISHFPEGPLQQTTTCGNGDVCETRTTCYYGELYGVEQYLLRTFLDCNVDGCVYQYLQCPYGCNATGDGCILEPPPTTTSPDTSDDPCANVDCSGWPQAECENKTSQTKPGCIPETGRCGFTEEVPCGDAGCNQDTGLCNETSGGNRCDNVFCPERRCSTDYSMSLSISCNPDNGQCDLVDFDQSYECPLGCDKDTGMCKEEIDPCLGIICPAAKCDGDISHSGFKGCEPAGVCYYADKLVCDHGCNVTTGLCLDIIDSDPDDKCAGKTCKTVICSPDGTESWINPDCDPKDGLCHYDPVPCDAKGCNPETGACYTALEVDLNDSDEYFCEPVTCSNDGRESLFNPEYNPADNYCYYDGIVPCDERGCNPNSGLCYAVASTSGDGPGLLGVLATIGGATLLGGGALGGGYLGLRALQRRNIIDLRQIISNIPRPSRFDGIEQNLKGLSNSIENVSSTVNSMERASLQRGLDTTANLMESYHRSAAATENIALLPGAVKFVADTVADIVGLAPGAGRYFKWAYHSGTTFIQEGIENGIGSGIYQAAGKAVETVASDWFGDIVKTPNIKSIQRFTTKTRVKEAIKSTGMKAIGQNAAKDKVLGKFLKTVNDRTSDFLFGE